MPTLRRYKIIDFLEPDIYGDNDGGPRNVRGLLVEEVNSIAQGLPSQNQNGAWSGHFKLIGVPDPAYTCYFLNVILERVNDDGSSIKTATLRDLEQPRMLFFLNQKGDEQ